MTLVLVVLAAIWVAVLLPPALRARAEGRPADSISAFRRQLAVLHRARPYASRSGEPAHRRVSRPAPSVIAADFRPRPLPSARRSARGLAAAGPARAAARRLSPHSQTLRRRRDILTGLLVTAAVTLFLGLFLGVRMMLAVHLVTDLLLAAYVAMLIRQRTLAAERELKVRFLRPRTLEPALLRRSVN